MTTEICYHCGLPLPKAGVYSARIDEIERKFCCNGCKSVCLAIYDAGLEGFYQRADGAAGVTPLDAPSDANIYDIEEVAEEFVVADGDSRSTQLLVEGIHCAACVWLIERAMERAPGIESAQVNLAAKRLTIRWSAASVKLSEIIKRLGRIGYSAVPYSAKVAEESAKKTLRSMLFRIGFAGFTAMNMMWIAIALWTGAEEGPYRQFFHYVAFGLATPTLFYSGYPFFKGAITGLRGRHLTMDLPIVIGALTTFFYSTYVTVANAAGQVYFDTVVAFIFTILVGRYLEASSKYKASDATKRLMELQPKVATLVKDGAETVVSVRVLKVGDTVFIKPGEKIPVDGEVIDGVSEVDESILTGESVPIPKTRGGRVIAGALNGDGALTVRVESSVKETVLARMARLIDEAQASRAPIQRMSDIIVPWFVTATLVLAAATFIYWRQYGVEQAIITSTAVLIITCPCALGMATPMAVIVAAGYGARRGILVKSGEALETLARVNHFVFDKTGAVTEGRMKVAAIHPVDGWTENELLLAIAAVERKSEHHIARAIVGAASERLGKEAVGTANDFSYTPGLGVAGTVDGKRVAVGSAKWLASLGIRVDDAESAPYETKGVTCVFCAVDGAMAGFVAVSDTIKRNARAVMDTLREDGIKLTLLTGDRRVVAESVVGELGDMKLQSEMKPADKDDVIRRLREAGDIVAMVGDGVNDAPALNRASVGIAMDAGADVSIESADIVLTASDIGKVKEALDLSRRTIRTIRQNMALAMVYNIIMVPLAMAGYITPVIAAITMPLSSLVVIGNAARIRRD